MKDRGRNAVSKNAGFAALGLLLGIASACHGEGKVIGSFTLESPAVSYIRDSRNVRFSGWETEEPKVRSITTNIHHQDRGMGGSRLAFTGRENFTLEISLKDIPPRSTFVTAFGIPIKDAYFSKEFSAAYAVTVNGQRVVNQDIGSFTDTRNHVWHEARVELYDLAGKDALVRLEASVNPPGTNVLRGWAEPHILVTREYPWRESSEKRPNILVVLVDTLRAENLGCYGYQRATSPNLDAFAAKSLVFENTIAPSSWTWPSTASVLTGQYPLHHGVLDGARSRLDYSRTTLAELCADAGLKTAAFVANPLISPGKNFDQGFETFEFHVDGDAGTMVDLFVNWLEQAREGRFMAYIHFMDPHSPYNPPEGYIARFSDPRDPNRLSEDAWRTLANQLGTRKKTELTEADRMAARNALDRYDSEILYWDEQFGRLLGVIESLGLSEKTIIAVTADHGEEFLDHGLLEHGWMLYDPAVKVPLVLRGPGIEPGRIQEQVELISIAPTLLEAAGLEGEGAVFDGGSLLGLGERSRSKAAFLHTEHAFSKDLNRRTSLYALRTEQWKLIYNPHGNHLSLYDLREDGDEQVDLAREPDLRGLSQRFAREIKEWIKRYEGKSPNYAYEVDDETLQAMKQLGYF